MNLKSVCVALMLVCGVALAEPARVELKLDPASRGATIPGDFIGLSFEMQLLLPDKDGKRYFSPENTALIATLKQLGVKSIRVGGNTADNPAVAVPGPEDIDSLFALAREVDAKVIYTLRLRNSSDPSDAVRIARYVMDKYSSQVECLAIGNEPNVYAKTYEEYRALLTKFMGAITAPDVAPKAVFCGPSTTPGKAAWARDLAREFGQTGKIRLITQHSYPGSSAKRVTDVAAARDKMLSTDWINGYEKFYQSFVPAVFETGLRYRMEEVNSFFHGGAKDVSDTLASALWALDYMHFWAARGCAGLNFHTGDNVASGDNLTPCRYAIFWTSPKGYNVRPIGYAVKAFDIGGRGSVVPAAITSNEKNVNLTAYAVAGADGRVYVTLINKSYGSTATPVTVAIAGAGGFTKGESMRLAGPDADIAATTGVTLGGAAIEDDASWAGKWSALQDPSAVEVPAASAIVVRLSR